VLDGISLEVTHFPTTLNSTPLTSVFAGDNALIMTSNGLTPSLEMFGPSGPFNVTMPSSIASDTKLAQLNSTHFILIRGDMSPPPSLFLGSEQSIIEIFSENSTQSAPPTSYFVKDARFYFTKGFTSSDLFSWPPIPPETEANVEIAFGMNSLFQYSSVYTEFEKTFAVGTMNYDLEYETLNPPNSLRSRYYLMVEFYRIGRKGAIPIAIKDGIPRSIPQRVVFNPVHREYIVTYNSERQTTDSNYNWIPTRKVTHRYQPVCSDSNWCGSQSDNWCNVACNSQGFCESSYRCLSINQQCITTSLVAGTCSGAPSTQSACPEPKPQPTRFFACDATRGVWVANGNLTLASGEKLIVSQYAEITANLVIPPGTQLVFELVQFLDLLFFSTNGQTLKKRQNGELQAEAVPLLIVNGSVTLNEEPVTVVMNEGQVDGLNDLVIGKTTNSLTLVSATNFIGTATLEAQVEPGTAPIPVGTITGCKTVDARPEQTARLLNVLVTVDDQCNLCAQQPLFFVNAKRSLLICRWWIIFVPIVCVLVIATVVIYVLVRRWQRKQAQEELNRATAQAQDRL